MLNEAQIRELVADHGKTVNAGRSIGQLIKDGEIPRLQGANVLKGKVSDSVFSESLLAKSGQHQEEDDKERASGSQFWPKGEKEKKEEDYSLSN